MQLVTIDLVGAAMLPGPEEERLAESVRCACINDGFFYVTNHGVPADLIERTAIPLALTGLLYALPGTQLTRRLAAEGS